MLPSLGTVPSMAQPIVSKVSRDPAMHRDAELKPTSIYKTVLRTLLTYRILITRNAQRIIKKLIDESCIWLPSERNE
jgi:hypothetical protein